MRWAWNADCMRQMTNPYDVRVGKPEGKKTKDKKTHFSLSVPQKYTGGAKV
jgi:hypothetical protein